jgi:beta-glucuronidase
MLMGHLAVNSTVGRNVIDMAGFWDFRLDPEHRGEVLGWPNGWRGAGERLYVPGCWNEQNPKYDQYHDVAWYCRSFAVSPELEGKALWLECEGIDYIADVWVNGRKVCRHEGGYTPFKARVGSAVLYGRENTIVVRVDSRHDTKTLPQGDRINLAIDWPYTGGIFHPSRPDATTS